MPALMVRPAGGDRNRRQSLAKRRRHWLAATAGLALVFCAGGVAGYSWDGRNSSSTLSFEEAIRIVSDESANLERRRAALSRVFSICDRSAQAVRVLTERTLSPLHADATIARAKLSTAWSNK